MVTPDFSIENHGSIALLAPRSDEAREHLSQVVAEGAQWWAGALAVEPRYLGALVEYLAEAGFVFG